MNSNYAPLNNTPYKNINNLTDGINEEYSNPYDVERDHYTKIALRQWKMCPSKVADEYFCVSNIKRIQKLLKKEIYKRSYKKFNLIEEQNVLDLLQVMIVIYEQYGKDLPFSIIRQVKVLNTYTIQYIAPDIIVNLKQHYGYLNEIQKPLNPLPLPLNVNNAGRKNITGTAHLYGL